jgi:stage III sporulation protein AB
MNYTLKIFGLSLLLIAAWLLGRAYSSYCKKRLLELSDFLSLISHIKKKVSLYLSTQSELMMGFSGESIRAFTDSFNSVGSFSEAFETTKKKTALSEKTKTTLSEFFSGFGKSYREGELERIDIYLSELSEELKTEEEDTPRRVKLAYTLLFAAALSAVIILL